MPGPLVALAPMLIPLATSLIAGFMNKKKGGAIDPNVLKELQLKNAMTERRGGYLDQLESGLNRGKLLDQDTGKVLRMYMPGIGGSQEKFDKGMDAFLKAADFGLKNDQGLLAQLIAGSQATANTAATQAGSQANFAAGQKATGSLATALTDIARKGIELYGGKGTNAIADVAAAASSGSKVAQGGFDFNQLLDNAGGGLQ